jgi:hypothetical protein
MNKEKTQEEVLEETSASEVAEETRSKKAQKSRQIIIETDGNDIRIVKSEVSGKIELLAIVQMIADSIRVQRQ